jgi:hypothetical protein
MLLAHAARLLGRCAHNTAGAGATVADGKSSYGPDAAADWGAAWERVLFQLVQELPSDVRQQVVSLAIDGTSATSLLVDRNTGATLACALHGPLLPAAGWLAGTLCIQAGCAIMASTALTALRRQAAGASTAVQPGAIKGRGGGSQGQVLHMLSRSNHAV